MHKSFGTVFIAGLVLFGTERAWYVLCRDHVLRLMHEMRFPQSPANSRVARTVLRCDYFFFPPSRLQYFEACLIFLSEELLSVNKPLWY